MEWDCSTSRHWCWLLFLIDAVLVNFVVVSVRFYSLAEMNSEFVLLQCLSATIYPAAPWCPSVCLTLWKPSASILSVAGFFRLVGQSECVCVCVQCMWPKECVRIWVRECVWCVFELLCVCDVCVYHMCMFELLCVCVCVSHTCMLHLNSLPDI